MRERMPSIFAAKKKPESLPADTRPKVRTGRGIDIDSLPAQAPEMREQETNFEITVFGQAKKGKATTRERSQEGYLLECYGEDVICRNEEKGIVIFIDGVSTSAAGQSNTLEMAKKAARTLMWLMEHLDFGPETEADISTEGMIHWLNSHIEYLLSTLSLSGQGAIMASAIRYLPERKVAIVFDIGTNQFATIKEGESANIKQHQPPRQKGPEKYYIYKSINGAAEIKDEREPNRRTPHIYAVQIKPDSIIIGGSDGLQETTGRSMADAADDIIAGKISSLPDTSDDITYFILKTKERANGQEAAA